MALTYNKGQDMIKRVEFEHMKEGHLYQVTYLYFWKILVYERRVLLNEYAVN